LAQDYSFGLIRVLVKCRLFLYLFSFIAVARAVRLPQSISAEVDLEGSANLVLPVLHVPQCPEIESVGDFIFLSGRRRKEQLAVSNPPQQTLASLCWNATHLTVVWMATSNKVISNMSACHDRVWKQDALELYISPGWTDAPNYTEIDVSPAGALWLGRIQNPTGYMPNSSLTIQPDCADSGILHKVELVPEGFRVQLQIPFWFLVGDSATAWNEDVPREWRVNFYRWNKDPRNLTAWSVTYCDGMKRGKTCNDAHVPKYFGRMLLQ